MRASQPVERIASRTQQIQCQDAPRRQSLRDQSQSKTTTTRRESCLQPEETLQSRPTQAQLTAGGKTPAYLRGRNPYGTVLDRIEHPYRDPRPAATGPPSQIGAGPRGRLRTAGAFRFKTRDPSAQPKPAANEQDSLRRQPIPEQPIKSSAVKAARSMFESAGTPSSLASHSRPPEQASAVEADPLDGDGLQTFPLVPPKTEPTHRSNLFRKQTLKADAPKPGTTFIPRLSSNTRTGTAQRDNPFVRPKASGPHASSASSKANGHAAPNDAHRPLNTTVSPISGMQWKKADEPRSDAGTTVTRNADMVPEGNSQRQAPEKTVRYPGDHLYPSATESEKDAGAGQGQCCKQESERPGPHRHVREDFKEDRPLELIWLGQTGSEVSPSEKSLPINRRHDRVLAWSRSVSPKTSARQDMRSYHDNVDINIDTHGPEKYGTATVSSDNNRVIGSAQSQDDFARDHTQTANIGVQLGYDEMQVPDHIDWRAAYGRRKTQDFGFPGARIKPRGTNWNQRPHQASNGQRKGSGSRSPHSTTDSNVNGISRSFSQDPAGSPSRESLFCKKQRTWKKVFQNTSISQPVALDNTVQVKPDVRQHSSRMPTDKCGERLDNTLGYMINDLLQEHSSSLQDVINDLEDGQRNFPRLRRSPDKIEMQTGTAYTTYQPPRTYEELKHRPAPATNSQIHDYFVAWLQEHKWQPPFSHCPPLKAEKLNVGATGQIRPNVSDTYHVLRQSLRTVDDLVDLIESAADNFGVDLGRGPTASDEERYRDAPYEWT